MEKIINTWLIGEVIRVMRINRAFIWHMHTIKMDANILKFFSSLSSVKAYVMVGNSERLPKKHLRYVMDGMRLIDLVVDNIRSMGFRVIVYSKYPLDVNAEVILDSSTWLGEALYNILQSDDSFFVFGGDMPLIRREAVEMIIREGNLEITTVPRWRKTGYLEPLHAFYRSDVAQCFRRGKSLTEMILGCPRVKFVSADNMPRESFFNVNTEDDLNKLRKLLAGTK